MSIDASIDQIFAVCMNAHHVMARRTRTIIKRYSYEYKLITNKYDGSLGLEKFVVSEMWKDLAGIDPCDIEGILDVKARHQEFLRTCLRKDNREIENLYIASSEMYEMHHETFSLTVNLCCDKIITRGEVFLDAQIRILDEFYDEHIREPRLWIDEMRRVKTPIWKKMLSFFNTYMSRQIDALQLKCFKPLISESNHSSGNKDVEPNQLPPPKFNNVIAPNIDITKIIHDHVVMNDNHRPKHSKFKITRGRIVKNKNHHPKHSKFKITRDRVVMNDNHHPKHSKFKLKI